MNIAHRTFAMSHTSGSSIIGGETNGGSATARHAMPDGDADWSIDPASVLRLWPLIDVYGRIERARRNGSALDASSGAA